jgi:hypothetical protein
VRKRSLLRVESGPQRLKPDLFQSDTYGLKPVPFDNESFSAACKVRGWHKFAPRTDVRGWHNARSFARPDQVYSYAGGKPRFVDLYLPKTQRQ